MTKPIVKTDSGLLTGSPDEPGGLPSELPVLTDERGGLLMEALIVLLVLSLVGTAVLAGLSTTHRSGGMTEVQSLAENIARNQMEHALSQAYLSPPAVYPTVSVPAGFGVTASTTSYVVGETNVEKITVTVSHDVTPVTVLETLRFNQ